MSKALVKKHPGGRPSHYHEGMVGEVNSYYQQCVRENKMPTIEEVSLEMGIDDEQLVRYCKRYAEFRTTVNRLKKLQRQYLMADGLKKNNPVMNIFLLKANHGFIETEKVQHSGVDGNPLEIIFLREAKSITKAIEGQLLEPVNEASDNT